MHDDEIAGIEELSLAYLTLPLLEDAIGTYEKVCLYGLPRTSSFAMLHVWLEI